MTVISIISVNTVPPTTSITLMILKIIPCNPSFIIPPMKNDERYFLYGLDNPAQTSELLRRVVPFLSSSSIVIEDWLRCLHPSCSSSLDSVTILFPFSTGIVSRSSPRHPTWPRIFQCIPGLKHIYYLLERPETLHSICLYSVTTTKTAE